MISFCTWIKNRFHQFDQCWEVNLQRMGPDDEWVILDAGSDDGFEAWRCDDPRVKVTRSPVDQLHFAKMYNASHALAVNPVLVNLDADNFIGPKYRDWVIEKTLGESAVSHAWSNNWNDGTYGRIAYTREMFDAVGGYDERLGPCGFQDTDIMARMTAIPYRIHTSSDPEIYGGSVPNSRVDSMRFVVSDQDFTMMNSMNQGQSLENVRMKRIKANQPDGEALL